MPRANAPEDLLPLTPAVFHILVALSEGERHGYAIMRQVSARHRRQSSTGAGHALRLPEADAHRPAHRGIGRAAGPRVGRRTPTVLPHHGFRRAHRESGGAAAGDGSDGGACAPAAQQKCGRKLMSARSRHPHLVAWACRLYALVVWTYPAGLRREYQREMLLTFRNQTEDVLNSGGVSSVLLFVLHIAADWLRTLASEPEDPMTLSLLGTGRARGRRMRLPRSVHVHGGAAPRHARRVSAHRRVVRVA